MQLTPDAVNMLMASTAVYSVVGGLLFCLAWHVMLGALVLVRDGVSAIYRGLLRSHRPVTRPVPHHERAL